MDRRSDLQRKITGMGNGWQEEAPAKKYAPTGSFNCIKYN
jgi:hypothetical protein